MLFFFTLLYITHIYLWLSKLLGMFDHSISCSYMLDDNYYPRMDSLSLNLKDYLHHIFLKWKWSFNLTNLIWNLTWSHLLGFYQDRFRLVRTQYNPNLLAPVLEGSHVKSSYLKFDIILNQAFGKLNNLGISP